MEEALISPQESAPQVIGKGFAVRAGAYILDVVFTWIITLVLSLVVGFLLGIILALAGREINFAQEQFRVLDLLIGLVTFTLYFMIFEWLYGATPGKVILGMRVVLEDGRPCTLGAALIRGLLRYIDGLFFGIPAYATMKEPLLQRIGDKAAKTVVVGAKDTFIQHTPEWWWLVIAAGIYLGIEIIASFIQTISLLR
ncbi:MAG TPA: RDD family protein [Anaerolineales bacterium]|nr:RDD family protein [Anaerolineales bacterium]